MFELTPETLDEWDRQLHEDWAVAGSGSWMEHHSRMLVLIAAARERDALRAALESIVNDDSLFAEDYPSLKHIARAALAAREGDAQ